jgi:hypothetical protein
MGWVIYTTRSEAETLQATIDAALGWPKVGPGVCQRVHVGGGRHVEHPACCTLHHCAVIQHPSRNEWAVPIDSVSRPVAGAVVEVALPGDWSRLP